MMFFIVCFLAYVNSFFIIPVKGVSMEVLNSVTYCLAIYRHLIATNDHEYEEKNLQKYFQEKKKQLRV